jgi:hypothetical protein
MEEINRKTDAKPYAKLLRIFSICLAFLFGVSLALLPQAVTAASLYFSPSSGSYAVGSAFSVSVYASSADQAMNAASGVVSFPQDKLEVTSLSKSGSIFSLWVQEPSFSNSVGAINFEGIVLNPGFTGSGGKIFTINFKAKSAGTAVLNFSSGSALANDGQGTNILGGMGSANYQLSAGSGTPTEPITETKPTVTTGVPAAPRVLSSTHPDSNKWYSNKNPQFSWTLPADVNGVSFYFSQSPTSNPGSVSDGLLASKSYENVEDGIWYFHIKMRNSAGWGPISHFKIQIDTAPPESFNIKFIDGKETDNPRPTVVFDTADSLSGIDHYKIKIGEGDFFNLSSETLKDNSYTLPPQTPGKRNILVQAFDKAGNYTVAVGEFEILAIETPVINDYPKKLQSGEPLVVRGVTYPSGEVTVWLQKDGDDPKSYTVESDQNGEFSFAPDEKLSDGIYKIWAEVTDSRGAKSLPTEKIIILVAKSAIFRIGTWTVSFLSVVIPLVALIILLLIILWYGWHKFSLLRKRLRKEVREAESALYKGFDMLKEDMQEQIKMLEKVRSRRQLTKEEERIVKRLKRDLDNAEKFIRKEIEDIEKGVK